MKKYISLTLASVMAIGAYASQQPDSVSTYSTAAADSVIIIQNAKGVTVQVKNNDPQGQKTVTFNQPSDGNMMISTRLRRAKSGNGLFDHRISKCDESGICCGTGGVWEVGMGGLSLGFTTPLSESIPTNIEMGKSLEIGWLEALSLRYEFPGDKNAFEIGFGFNWRNFKTTMPSMFVSTPEGVTMQPYPDGVVPQYSRLKVFSLTVPVLYKFTTPVKSGSWQSGFYVGGIVNFNTHASSLTVWRNAEGNIQKKSCNDVYQRKVSVDILAGIRVYNSLSVFVKYSPMKVLEKGPQFSSLTTGLMIGL